MRAPRWAVAVAAGIAAVAGVVAVVTAGGVAAVVAGTASAVTAVLVLAAPRVPVDAAPAPGPAPTGTPEPAPAPADPEPDLEPDPMRELFEAGPPAGGTSLLGAEFVVTTLRGRIAVARRALRPLSVVRFEVLDTVEGQPTAAVPADTVARVLRRTLREADVAGRADEDGFVCILEDTGEDGAVWTAERIRRSLADDAPQRRFRAGIASYPTHGLDAEELEDRAREALRAARDWGTDRIEVATSP